MTEEEKAAAEAAQREAAEAEAAAAAEAAAQAEAEAQAALKAKSKKTTAKVEADDESAAELARVKAELDETRARFAGIDPAAAKEAMKKVSAAETAARNAEKAKAEAEGNWTRLREIAQEEHNAQVTAAAERATAAEARAAQAEARANDLFVSSAFANSDFIREKLILTPGKAQRLFGDHVDIVDGDIVVYDKPRGASGRNKVMDSKGKPLPFDVAIAKVVEADTDKDRLLKTSIKPGANSKGNNERANVETDRRSKFERGIAQLIGG